MNIPIWSGSSTFTPGETPFGFYDNDLQFQVDIDKFAIFASRRLGYPIVEIELQDLNFYAAFEEAINKIKQMFAEAGEMPMPSAKPLQSFAEYTLKSGAKVMIDKLEVGGKVTLVDEGGNEVPAPVGDHELIDGSVITLDVVFDVLK